MKRVVITGYGLVTPLGFCVEHVWKKICSGESGIARTSFPLPFEKSLISGECRDFTTNNHIPPHEAKKLERFAQYVMVAGIDAVNHAGLDFSQEDRDRCAVVVGSGVGGLGEIENQHDRLVNKGFSKISPFTIPKIMPNAGAGNLSIHYGLTGPAYSVNTACATASYALADAVRLIRNDEADIVLAGGSEAAATFLGIAGFCAMHALSERNDEPTKASRPFDRDRDGFVLSDGCGVLTVESLEHAKKRRADILGEILGTGLTSDAFHIAQPQDSGLGAAKAIQIALRHSKINAEQIDYINAHGTGTKIGDLVETKAIKQVFGDNAKKVAISSTKSQIGHLLGGSGAVELIFSLLAIRDNVIPPTINLENPDPECDLDYTPLVAREKRIDTVLSNSFGFGGHNGCVIATRFRE